MTRSTGADATGDVASSGVPPAVLAHKRTVADLLIESAATASTIDAVVGADGSVTFGELLERASTAAAIVSRAGRGPVAIHLDDRIEPVVVAVGALLAGRAVVPLDPHVPPDRVARIVELAGAQLLDIGRMPTATETVPPRARPDDPCTIIFTSGSTGEPKGVVFDHENAVGKALDVVAGQAFERGDRIANVMPLGFSAGMTTLLAGIAAGATILLADSRRVGVEPLLGWLEDEGATAISSSVSLVRRLASAVRDGDHPPLTTVRQITFYGEPSNGGDVELARRLADPIPRVINWYGATETGVIGYTAFGATDDVPPGRVVAGRGLPGPRRVMILDDEGRPAPVGESGEVTVRGGTIAQGYVSGPSDRFLADVGSGRGYRTGDRGFLDGEGRLHIVGRADDAVKIRGYFVEPAEVEVAIVSMPEVDEVFVRGHDVDDRTELVAYVGSSLLADELEERVRAHAVTSLAPWMVPRFVVVMSALPRTNRGKVDRDALPQPATERRRRHRSPDLVESAVRLAVTRAMGHDDVDADQDLVAMGVDSLMLARISLTLRQLLNIEVDLAAFTAAPTIATLTRGVRQANSSSGDHHDGGVLVPLRTGGDLAALFLVAGAGAPASAFIPLVRALQPTRPVYGLQARGLEHPGRPDRSIVAMARRNIEHLTTVQPRGPYVLAGHSMGGLVALEMAAQLLDRGESVAHVVQIDSALTPSLIADLDVHAALPDDELHLEAGGPEQPIMNMTTRQLLGLFLKLPLVGRRVFDPVTQWIVFYHRGARMARKHRLRRVDTPVTVLCARGSTHRRSWWNAVSTGSVTLVSVPGGHVDVLHAPNVIAVAAALDAAIQRPEQPER